MTTNLLARAQELVTLDADGRNPDAATQAAILMAEYDITPSRANTAIATAARRLRNEQLIVAGPATYTLRVRLTEAQRERLALLAEQEAGGDVSRLVRMKLFA